MIVTELRFVLLVVACWATFFALPPPWRASVLAFWGLVFYTIYAATSVPLVVGLVVAVHLLSRPRLAWIAVVTVVGLLAYFKWNAAGADAAPATGTAAAVLIPLGFSFLAFELIHVALDRGRGLAGGSLTDLAAFALFFPSRIAGPLKRLPDFTAAVARAEASSENVYAGLCRILLGLVKKVVIADTLGLMVAEVGYAATPAHVWRVVLAYSLQIFFDFSAYSDVAVGVSRVLGIKVPENFQRPYLSPNIQEFWNRWHITLSTWVRGYVFLPLGHRLFRTGLRRHPLGIAAASYLVSFVIVGAWHGLAPNYVVWGAYHGLLLTGYHAARTVLPPAVALGRLYTSRVATVAGTALTFGLVSIGWVPFMTDLPDAWRLLRIMFLLG